MYSTTSCITASGIHRHQISKTIILLSIHANTHNYTLKTYKVTRKCGQLLIFALESILNGYLFNTVRKVRYRQWKFVNARGQLYDLNSCPMATYLI